MPQAETQTTAAQVLGSSEAEPTEQATPATPVVDEKVSPKLQVLIQRERAAIARERSAKEKETGISTRLQELEAREAKIKEFESIKKTNPMRALEMLDMSYQDLTQVALADGNVTPEIKIRQLEERLKNFENQEAIKAQKQEEYQKSAEQKQLDTTVKTFKSEIGSYIKGNAISLPQC